MSNGRVDAVKQAAALSFEYQDAAGLRVKKDFRFDPQNYVVAFSARVMSGDRALNPTIAWGPGLSDAGAKAGGGSFFTGNYVQPPQAIYHKDGDVERVAAASIPEQPAFEGPFRFAGIDDHYFLAAAVDPGNARVEFKPVTLPGPDDTQRQLLAATFRFPQPPQGRSLLRRAKTVRRFAVGGSGNGPRDLVRRLRFSRRAPLDRAEMGLRVHRQLRLVDHLPDASSSISRSFRSATRASSRCGRCRSCSRS